MDDVGPGELLEPAHHRQRRLRGSGDQPDAGEIRSLRHLLHHLQHRPEDGRGAVGQCDLLLDEGLGDGAELLGGELARQDEFGTGGHSVLREAPRQHMEHRGDGHDAVVEVRVQCGKTAHGVQVDRAVRVVHALGSAGGAGGVSGVGGGLLVDDGPVEGLGFVGDEVFVGHDVGQARLDLRDRLVGHDDPALDVELRRQRFGDLQQGFVDEDPVRLRVADDIGEVFGSQAQVELEHGRGHTGDSEVELEVAAGVPVEDSDHGAGADAEVGETLRELSHPLELVGVVRPAPGTVRTAVDDFDIAEDGGSVPDEGGGVELVAVAQGGRNSCQHETPSFVLRSLLAAVAAAGEVS